MAKIKSAKKNLAAVELGRLGATALNRKLTPAQRKESARNAARARWAKTSSPRRSSSQISQPEATA